MTSTSTIALKGCVNVRAKEFVGARIYFEAPLEPVGE